MIHLDGNIKVLKRIPFDPAFTQALVHGKIIMEFDNHSKGCGAVKNIWEDPVKDIGI